MELTISSCFNSSSLLCYSHHVVSCPFHTSLSVTTGITNVWRYFNFRVGTNELTSQQSYSVSTVCPVFYLANYEKQICCNFLSELSLFKIKFYTDTEIKNVFCYIYYLITEELFYFVRRVSKTKYTVEAIRKQYPMCSLCFR